MKSVDLLKNKGVMNFTPIFLLIIAYSFLQGILFEYIFKNIVGYNIISVLCSYILSAVILFNDFSLLRRRSLRNKKPPAMRVRAKG